MDNKSAEERAKARAEDKKELLRKQADLIKLKLELTLIEMELKAKLIKDALLAKKDQLEMEVMLAKLEVSKKTQEAWDTKAAAEKKLAQAKFGLTPPKPPAGLP